MRSWALSVACVVVLVSVGASCSRGASSRGASRPAEVAPAETKATAKASTLEVAITVDDLPYHGPDFPGIDRRAIADSMLASLTRHGVPGVYGFVNGKTDGEVPASRAVLEAWLSAGYPLGNHSWSHPSLNDLTVADYLSDVEQGEEILRELTPSGDWHYFRYPFLQEGNTLDKQERVRGELQARGYRIAPVTIDGNDWAYNPVFARCKERQDEHGIATLRRDFVAEHLGELARIRELTRRLVGREVRHVLLLHVGAADADAIESLLSAYEKAGARWIDLPTALDDPFYALDAGGPYVGGAALPYRIAAVRKLEGVSQSFGRQVVERIDAICR